VRDLLKKTVEAAGGRVEQDRFVVEPGLFEAAQSSTLRASSPMAEVCRLWGVDPDQPFSALMAECAALVTYLNPASRRQSGSEYVQSVLDLGHDSIMGQSFVTLGLFGVPLEIVIELLAHGLDSTARQTSSAVLSMSDPLFCTYAPSPMREWQMEQVEQALVRHRLAETKWPQLSGPVNLELRNSLLPSNRAVFLFVGMRIIDWQKLLKKRLPRLGNEAMLRVVCQRICLLLRSNPEWAALIASPESYGWDAPW